MLCGRRGKPDCKGTCKGRWVILLLREISAIGWGMMSDTFLVFDLAIKTHSLSVSVHASQEDDLGKGLILVSEGCLLVYKSMRFMRVDVLCWTRSLLEKCRTWCHYKGRQDRRLLLLTESTFYINHFIMNPVCAHP